MSRVGSWILSIGLLTALVAGCNFGPRQFRQGRIAYNEAVRLATDQELLLNIVRLRYHDSIEFLETASISSQVSFSVGVAAEGGTAGGDALGVGRATALYSERPTFVFTPQRGEAFARRLIEPVSLDTLIRLIAAEWSAQILLQLLVQQMNGLQNDPSGPVDEAFLATAERIGALQRRNDLAFGFVPGTEPIAAALETSQVSGGDAVEAARSGYSFEPAGGGRLVLTRPTEKPVLVFRTDSPETDWLRQALGLAPGVSYPLFRGTLPKPEDAGYRQVAIRTGSLMEALVYLARGVVVPPEHRESGEAPPIDYAAELIERIEPLFQVRSASHEPDARLQVSYRDRWYYLDDADSSTRHFFMVATELFRLVLGTQSDERGPVLTLPVGGPS